MISSFAEFLYFILGDRYPSGYEEAIYGQFECWIIGFEETIYGNLNIGFMELKSIATKSLSGWSDHEAVAYQSR